MKHDWALDEYTDKPDIFQLAEGIHNGPRCLRCGEAFCHHCHRDIYDEECPSGQLAIGEPA